ncbi:hypothetical protein FRC20_000439 [Serendipita sp. 405]|nr:hypothetical protein FRC20_000439 [Serendipita sp. 405]
MARRLEHADVWKLSPRFLHANLFRKYLASKSSPNRAETTTNTPDGQENKRKKKREPLIMFLLKANSADILLDIALEIYKSFSGFIPAYALKQLLSILATPDDGSNNGAWGNKYVQAHYYALMTFVANLSFAQCDLAQGWCTRRCYERTRGVIFCALHYKALRRRVIGGAAPAPPKSDKVDQEEQPGNKGDGNAKDMQAELEQERSADLGKVVNLMQGDAYAVAQRFWELSPLFGAPIRIAVALYFLHNILGTSAFAGVAVILSAYLINWPLMKWNLHITRYSWKARDKRMTGVNELFQSIRFLKLMGWEGGWAERVLQSRELELAWRVQENICSAILVFIWTWIPSATALASFIAYTLITFLVGLLGEMSLLKGKVHLDKSNHKVAYCAQLSWLEHATIRDNIVYGSPLGYDEARYDAVVAACALERDLEILPAGDMTEIGEKGVSLSGGQRARVALARALYSPAKTILLDDPLAAVDMHTARHLVQHCFGGPLMANRTVVLVTHHVKLCLPSADYLVEIHGGRIEKQGSIAELKRRGQLTEVLSHDVVETEPESSDKSHSLENEADLVLGSHETPDGSTKVGASTPSDEGETENQNPKKPKWRLSTAEAGKLVDEEARAEGRVSWRTYKTYIQAAGYWSWGAAFLLMIQIRGINILNQFYLSKWGEAYNHPKNVSYLITNWLGDMKTLGSVVVYLTTLFALSAKVSTGFAAVVILNSEVFAEASRQVVRVLAQVELDFNSVERIGEYLDVVQEAPAIIEKSRPPAYWPSSTNGISVEDLWVRYSETSPDVLLGLSFEIRPGEKVGVVGRTGSGKTTLCAAFLRVVEARQGRIMVDGIDISKIGLEDLRTRITVVSQDVALFEGSVRSNLDPFEEHSDEECWDVLRRCHLATNLSTSETNGAQAKGTLRKRKAVFTTLEEQISVAGGSLSAGQRQLVALARAMLRRSQVVLTDEATSAIDLELDDQIQQTIRQELGDATVITIAHRLRTVIEYDRILVLDRGRIVEFDTPARLLRNPEGVFAKLCRGSADWEDLKRLVRE